VLSLKVLGPLDSCLWSLFPFVSALRRASLSLHDRAPFIGAPFLANRNRGFHSGLLPWSRDVLAIFNCNSPLALDPWFLGSLCDRRPAPRIGVPQLEVCDR